MRRCQLLCLTICFLCSLSAANVAAANQKNKRLVRVLKNDSSYKVRLQALRILGKQLKGKVSNNGYLIEQMSEVAKNDSHYMVRGLACFLLGQSKSEKGRDALQFALQDPHPFVRVQSESALSKLVAASPAMAVKSADTTATSTATGMRALVFTAETMPGTPVSAEMVDTLAQRMEQQLRALASERFAIQNHFSGSPAETKDAQFVSGFKFRASIAERTVNRELGTQVRSTMTVRVTITTWPGNQLRHVISATASGVIRRPKKKAILKLESQVLMSAIDQAVRDAVKEISTS